MLAPSHYNIVLLIDWCSLILKGFPGESGPDDGTLSSDIAAKQHNGGADGQPDFAFYGKKGHK